MPNPVKYADLKTEAEKKEFLQEKLQKDDRWIARGLLTMYSKQTTGEQRQRQTFKQNGQGFTAFDGEILSKYAKRLRQMNGREATLDLSKPFVLSFYFSAPEEKILRYKMKKYWRQLMEIADARLADGKNDR